ncbi:hypothetical protein [Gordonibacter massiliensis (ex Traore et al. 2017)]|uniref:hypothetical protein n=1 Tax=Gordonibacter massiliensis (ex Traore et al. 2017) TaxID=1841863 RepID=UPI001C8C6667|nr:hypothetical protein [Gordonibacter massiliensis (ex Traore et al. 2017)]MBX9035025.1 hypothetical protein [Gordonibacter massiliensis (ex Traore et al. 2017)]
MAEKATGQVTIVDITDGVSIMLTSESYTFPGTTTGAVAGSCTTQVVAIVGTDPATATVTASECTCPAGITVSVNANSGSPVITVSAAASFRTAGVVKIPVHCGEVTITKEFSVAVALRGTDGTSVTVSSTSVTYQQGDSGTAAPTGSWAASVPATTPGKYLWTKTVVSYSDGKSTTSYSVSRNPVNGSDGASVTVTSTAVTYQVSGSGTATPTGTWATSIPATSAGQYLWTRTVVTYSDGKSTTSYSVSRNGSNGAAGADALTLAITSSNGLIFKNSDISTVLTAHVYKAGTEVTGAALTALGSIKWYKDGGTTAVATGATLTISAGDVDSKASYVAKLEG